MMACGVRWLTPGAVALPPFPRSPGAELGIARAAPKGVRPLTDEETRPFAGLAALRDRLADDDES